MDLALIRAALAAAADVIDDLNTYPTTPDSVSEPALYPAEVETDFSGPAQGYVYVDVTLRLLVSRADDEAGDENLSAYLATSGDKSIRAALYADDTLGGVCEDLWLVRLSAFSWHEMGTNTYLGADLTVRVLAAL